MKVLITGGTGFQGSNLAKSLLDDGHQVRLLNLYSEKSKTNVEIFKLKEISQNLKGPKKDVIIKSFTSLIASSSKMLNYEN